MLLAVGAVVDRVNKWPMVLSFLGAYFALFAVLAFLQPAQVAPTQVAEMFRDPFVQAVIFLAAFMLTDPPTSPGRYVDQVWIGLLAAVVSGVAQLQGAGQAYLLIGPLAGNLALAARRAIAGALATH